MKKDTAVFTRRSVRAYDSSKRVSKEQIEDILDAAMHAPSAMNKQPWRFVVATEDAVLDALTKAHPYCESVKDAHSAIIVCGDLDEQFSTPCGGYYEYDCSAAAQNILIRAKELGLGTCWCGIAPEKERMEAISKLFGMPPRATPPPKSTGKSGDGAWRITQVFLGLVKLADKCVSLVAAWSRTPVRSRRLIAQSRISSLSLTSLSSAAGCRAWSF